MSPIRKSLYTARLIKQKGAGDWVFKNGNGSGIMVWRPVTAETANAMMNLATIAPGLGAAPKITTKRYTHFLAWNGFIGDGRSNRHPSLVGSDHHRWAAAVAIAQREAAAIS